LSHTSLRSAKRERTISRDLATGETTYSIFSDGGDFEGAALARVHAIDLDIGYTILKRFQIGDIDPLSACAEIVQNGSFRREGWAVRIDTRTQFRAGRDTFQLVASLEAWEGEERIFAKDWNRVIPRDLV